MRFTQIVFRHMAHSVDIGERIREMSGALEEAFPKIQRCRAIVEEFRAPGQARALKVTLEVRIGADVLTASAHGAYMQTVLDEVFGEMRAKIVGAGSSARAAG